MNSNLKLEKCPVANTHRRLNEVGLLLDEVASTYHHPDKFVMNVNHAIQGMRNVTFILQSEKASIPNFDSWYESWREQLKKDVIMKWLHQARNKIVKQGDLEVSSWAKVVIKNWLNFTMHEVKVCPTLSASELVDAAWKSTPKAILDKFGDALVSVERYWAVTDFPNTNVLSILLYGKDKLSDLVREAHNLCEVSFDKCELLHPLSLMSLDIHQISVAHLNPKNGEIFSATKNQVPLDLKVVEKARKRYEISKLNFPNREDDLFTASKKLSDIAKTMLVKDKSHVPMAFLYTSDGNMQIYDVTARDQEEKYLFYFKLANEVERMGATRVIFINEVWMINQEDFIWKRPSQTRGKKEALCIVAADSDGNVCSWNTPFKRDLIGRIILGETARDDRKGKLFLNPILRVWGLKEHIPKLDIDK